MHRPPPRNLSHWTPVYSKESLFSRGIINGDPTLRQNYQLTLHKTPEPQGFAEELFPGLFIIISYGEHYTLWCTAQPQQRFVIATGLYKVYLEPGCSIIGANRKLTGVTQYSSRITLRFPEIPIILFNLPEFLPYDKIVSHLKKPEWRDLPEISNFIISLFLISLLQVI